MGTERHHLLGSGLAVLMSVSCALAGTSAPAPSIDPESVTVSGLSSGGAMAMQLHLARADLVQGTGIVAGVPWGCAEGNLAFALGRCMGKGADPIPVVRLLDRYHEAEVAGDVAPRALLSDDRVWLFRGTLDETVPVPVTDAVARFYEALLGADAITRIEDVPAAHLLPTLSAGGPCDAPEAPWLGACDYDAAGELLGTLYPGLRPPTDVERNGEGGGAWRDVELPGASAAGLASEAWLFVPDQCPPSGCRLHLVLHGCLQSAGQVGRAFAEQSGYVSWARANGIVLAFPQVVASAVNPMGCWDWWGYAGADYDRRGGAQLGALAAWIEDLVGR